MNNKKRTLKKLFILLLLLPVCGILFILSYVFSLDGVNELNKAEISNMAESTRLYDKDQNEYLKLSGTQRRTCVKLETLPEYVKDAFICIEDARFYEHNGIDPVRIGGALLTDIKTGSLSQGASTITQQVVKNHALKFEKSFKRKLTEMMMALKLERICDKEEILQLYLNMVYFGGGAYGIEEASQTYFEKSAKDLTLSEAAALAGVINSPSAYSPVKHKSACKKRRNLVLKQMLENEKLSKEEYEKAINSPLEVKEAKSEEYLYGYYTDTVLKEATDILSIGYSELTEGGYKIYTYLDRELKSFIEENAKNDALFPENADKEKSQCACVVIDVKKKAVCALIGGREHTARLSFNRATDMKRQPGSAIKPVLVFAPSVEYENYTTTTFLLDEPVTYSDYSPRNSGSTFKGWISLRDTVAYSVNIPAVKLFYETGIERCKGYAKNAGIAFDKKDNNLSLALGGFTTGVTPLCLAGSYLPFADGGAYKKPGTIKKIVDKEGKTVYTDPLDEKYVLSESTAFLCSSMLRSSVEYGTAKALLSLNGTVCAKTGTSAYDDALNNKDAWITAYNPEYIITTWMGFDKTDSAHSLKKGVTGGTYPAEFTSLIFSKLYSQKEYPEFSVPESIVEVKIDKRSLSEAHEASLAVFSENGESVTEYYKKGTVPKSYAHISLPKLPRRFKAEQISGKPYITFDTQKDMLYTLLRDGKELLSFKGNGLTATYLDKAFNQKSALYTLKVSSVDYKSSPIPPLTASLEYTGVS